MQEVIAAETVRCRRVEVLDGDGVVRALLHTDSDSDDAVLFEMFNPKCTDSVIFIADEHGLTLLTYTRGNESVRVSVRGDGVLDVEEVTLPGQGAE